MWIVKKTYALILKCMETVLGIDLAKKFDTKFRFHKSLDLKNPKTLSERVTYIELHNQSPLAAECTDKYAVREYVKSKGLENILVPYVGGPWENVEHINFKELTYPCILKATHGCKMNYILNDIQNIDIEKCKQEMSKWLKVSYGSYSIEPHYKLIPHRIYAEQLIDGIDDLIDYKFHCINGNPEFVLTCSARQANGDAAMAVTLDLYDMEWNHIPEVVSMKNEIAGDGSIKKPETFERMKEIAKILSRDFEFVRVDLYEIKGNILFGELTFSPACCVFPYFSKKFDEEMGRRFEKAI